MRVQIINRLQLCFVALFPKIVYSQQFEEWKSSQQWWNRVVLPWWFSNHCHSAQTMLQLEWSQATLEFHSDEITSNLTKTKQSPAIFLWTPFFCVGKRWESCRRFTAPAPGQIPFVLPPESWINYHTVRNKAISRSSSIRLCLLKTLWHSKISSLLIARQLWPRIE